MKKEIRLKGTFHNLSVISDYDCIKVRNHFVLELYTQDTIICRFYDKHGIADDQFQKFDLLELIVDLNLHTEDSIVSYMLEKIGVVENLLISNGAVDLIKTVSL